MPVFHPLVLRASPWEKGAGSGGSFIEVSELKDTTQLSRDFGQIDHGIYSGSITWFPMISFPVLSKEIEIGHKLWWAHKFSALVYQKSTLKHWSIHLICWQCIVCRWWNITAKEVSFACSWCFKDTSYVFWSITDGLLAELQARMCKCCRFCCSLPHR